MIEDAGKVNKAGVADRLRDVKGNASGKEERAVLKRMVLVWCH